MRTLHIVIGVAVLIAGAFPQSISAQTPTAAANPAINSRMVSRELPLNFADLAQVEEMLSKTLSKEGSFVFLKIKRTVLVTDTPENIEAAREFLKVMGQPAPNVRIEVKAMSIGTSRTTGFGASGRITHTTPRTHVRGSTPGVTRRSPDGRQPPGVRGGRITTGSVDIDLLNQSGGSDSLNKSWIVVRSGGIGVLEVVREVPVVDFFLLYGAQRGFLTPEVRWEKIGTQLLVKPVVTGDYITVEVTPRISNLTIENRDIFRERPINRPLTGREQHIDFTQLTTTVVVQNGGTITIGGFSSASPEFNRHFYGYGNRTGASAGSITLTAKLQ